MKENIYRLWDELPFIGFDEEVFQSKKKDWYQYAYEILEKLQSGNTALAADTSADKTVITVLVVATGNFRCLFLAPSRYLCGQHQKLFRQITGNKTATRIITGVSPKRERFWHYPWEKVIFSTPHMAVSELGRGKLNLNEFDLVVVDEFHKASGNYPYTNITRRLERKTKILALSASPGDSMEKIKQVGKSCRLQNWVIADIPTPEKIRNVVVAEQDGTIQLISDCFEGLLKNVLRELNELMPELKLDLENKYLFTFVETENWSKKGNALARGKNKRSAKFLIAKYVKLYHCYTTAIQENYAAFLEYTATLKKQNTKSGQNILAQREFLRVVDIARENLDNHSKTLMLLKVLKQWVNFNKNAIVFVNSKATGAYLQSFLTINDIRVENIFGGGGKANLVKQQKALKSIASKELDVIVSTSVIEEGVSVPEVNMIIHYSHPSTGVGCKQRDGRTARLTKGNIIDLIIDHPLDRTDHLISRSKVKRGEKALREKVKNKQVQLSLFPEVEP